MWLVFFYSRKTSFRLYVALNDNEEAEGVLFWDDGDTIDTTNERCLINFEYKNKVRDLLMTTTYKIYNQSQ